jgi:intracellular septation protein
LLLGAGIEMQVALTHLLLDFLSTLFFLIVVFVTGNVALAIVLGIAAGLIQVAVQKYLGIPVPPMQLMALGLVVVLGSTAMITNDSRFVMIKPSISRFAFGVIMLRRGWVGRYLPRITRETLPAAVIERTGYAWAAVMFGLSILNLIVAMTLSVQAWVLYASTVPTIVKIVAFLATYLVLRSMVNRRLGPAPAA